jgi:hypothetical protein
MLKEVANVCWKSKAKGHLTFCAKGRKQQHLFACDTDKAADEKVASEARNP